MPKSKPPPSRSHKKSKKAKIKRNFWLEKKAKDNESGKHPRNMSDGSERNKTSETCSSSEVVRTPIPGSPELSIAEEIPIEPLQPEHNVVDEGDRETTNKGFGILDWPSEESESELPDLVVEKDPPLKPVTDCISGNRCVDIGHVFKQMESIKLHKKECTMGRYTIHSEKRSGFFSTWRFVCETCNQVQDVSSHKDDFAEDINNAAVWGAVSIGIGYSQLEEMFSIMDIPVMSCEKFQKHESTIQQV
ncbi:uncharacterized protein LOC134535815 [Bacillus rossius redtenbacheri]|uniref:uncharacterized protein LOC134535815 n=1 Tax=Bacillus rossius redtenbacheri TaxID=93214 RepID=UPI002FDD7B83